MSRELLLLVDALAREKKLERYLEAPDRVDKPLAGWQMKLEFRANNLICCSSQKPISRKRLPISGARERCLISTTVPALIWVSGHTSTPAQQPSRILH